MKDDFKLPPSPTKPPQTNNQTSPLPVPPPPKSSRPMKLLAAPKKFHWWLKGLNKRERFLALMAAVAILGGAGFVASKIWFSEPVVDTADIKTSSPAEPAKPTTVPDRLTGVMIPSELDAMPVTGVMIENSPDARPQAGIAGADMVYEAIAEGGITRFLVMYHTSQPEHIGPVRSVRPYFLDFLGAYDAPITHAGGSAKALAQIREQGLKDIDHGANGGSFDRVKNRFAPHNLYTSRARLLEVHKKRGYTSSTFTGHARKEKETPSPAPNARTINFTISSPVYNSQFVYDAENNDYKRAMAGKPHMDEKTGKQISPKVVVGLVVPHRYEGIYSVYSIIGNGTAYVFQDGIITAGTWQKSSRKEPIVLKNASGTVIPLNPGQTWFTVVAGADRVKATP